MSIILLDLSNGAPLGRVAVGVSSQLHPTADYLIWTIDV